MSRESKTVSSSLNILRFLGFVHFSFIMVKHKRNLPQRSSTSLLPSQRISAAGGRPLEKVKSGWYFHLRKSEYLQITAFVFTVFWRHTAPYKYYKYTQRGRLMMCGWVVNTDKDKS